MGIKSFQGNQVKDLKTVVHKVSVADCMQRNVIVFTEDMSLVEAMKIMIKEKVSGGPVVNLHREVVGILSEGDCVKQISDSRYYNMPMSDISVGSKMSHEIVTVFPTENIFDVASKFLNLKRRRFPVIENGVLVGLVSQKIVLRVALELSGNNWKK